LASGPPPPDITVRGFVESVGVSPTPNFPNPFEPRHAAFRVPSSKAILAQIWDDPDETEAAYEMGDSPVIA
jgi:hypothetical protein